MLINRYARLEYINNLCPIKDYEQIYRLTTAYEFPWDMTVSLAIALLRTFCVPSISKLLDQTGEFRRHAQKRYDDTGLLLAEIVKWGINSSRGCEAIERMNIIHGYFPITNSDYLYVLSTFIYEPIRWNERFGWRLMCENERLASFYFWVAVGEKMGIEGIPPTYEAFEEFNQNYEWQNFRYERSNQNVGKATVNLFLSRFPKLLHPLIQPWIYALMDEPMLKAFNFPYPSSLTRKILESSLKLRGLMQRCLLPKQNPSFYTDETIPSYPEGYQLTDLGPKSLLDKINHKLKNSI